MCAHIHSVLVPSHGGDHRTLRDSKSDRARLLLQRANPARRVSSSAQCTTAAHPQSAGRARHVLQSTRATSHRSRVQTEAGSGRTSKNVRHHDHLLVAGSTPRWWTSVAALWQGRWKSNQHRRPRRPLLLALVHCVRRHAHRNRGQNWMSHFCVGRMWLGRTLHRSLRLQSECTSAATPTTASRSTRTSVRVHPLRGRISVQK